MTDRAISPPLVDPHYAWIGLSVQRDRIPYSLAQIDQWVLWKAEPRPGGGMNKIPYQPNGRKASSTDPHAWSDFATVCAALDESDDYAGIGFVVTANDGLACLDFDHVRNAETGAISPDILHAICQLGTYAEISPSGTGIRIIGRATLTRAISGKTLQGWSAGRYVTITGNRIDDAPADIGDIDPERLADVIAQFAPDVTPAEPTAAAGRPLDPRQVLEIRQALGYLDPDADYDTWIKIGMALHDTAAPNAFGLWNEWSMGGPKYDARVIRAKWASFGGHDGISLPTVFALAQQRGWVNPASTAAASFAAHARMHTPVETPSAPVYRASAASSFPQHLIDQAPGVIGELLQWGLRTAHKPQPQLALQAAIAIATTVMGRRYRTNHNNWPVLWFLGIALSASGKEHGKTMVEEALAAARLGHLIAGSGYTSPGAVFSTLLDKPSHISIIDEYGKLVESSQANGNQGKADAITMAMEAFGRAHGALRPANYSLMALTKEQRAALSNRIVYKPALQMLAMTTPSTFYGSLTRQWISDGFLGRMLICESPVGRQPSRYPPTETVATSCVDWLQTVSLLTATPPQGANMSTVETGSELEPTPVELRFTGDASAHLRAFERDVIASTNRVAKYGLDVLYGRTVEKAMRLAMPISLADNPNARSISISHVQYAIEFVQACDDATVEIVRWNVADSEFGRVKARCLDIVRSAGRRGVTARELARQCSAFNALRPREQSEVLEALHTQGHAELINIATPGGRGKKRMAWVALADEPDDEDGREHNE